MARDDAFRRHQPGASPAGSRLPGAALDQGYPSGEAANPAVMGSFSANGIPVRETALVSIHVL